MEVENPLLELERQTGVLPKTQRALKDILVNGTPVVNLPLARPVTGDRGDRKFVGIFFCFNGTEKTDFKDQKFSFPIKLEGDAEKRTNRANRRHEGDCVCLLCQCMGYLKCQWKTKTIRTKRKTQEPENHAKRQDITEGMLKRSSRRTLIEKEESVSSVTDVKTQQLDPNGAVIEGSEVRTRTIETKQSKTMTQMHTIEVEQQTTKIVRRINEERQKKVKGKVRDFRAQYPLFLRASQLEGPERRAKQLEYSQGNPTTWSGWWWKVQQEEETAIKDLPENEQESANETLETHYRMVMEQISADDRVHARAARPNPNVGKKVYLDLASKMKNPFAREYLHFMFGVDENDKEIKDLPDIFAEVCQVGEKFAMGTEDSVDFKHSAKRILNGGPLYKFERSRLFASSFATIDARALPTFPAPPVLQIMANTDDDPKAVNKSFCDHIRNSSSVEDPDLLQANFVSSLVNSFVKIVERKGDPDWNVVSTLLSHLEALRCALLPLRATLRTKEGQSVLRVPRLHNLWDIVREAIFDMQNPELRESLLSFIGIAQEKFPMARRDQVAFIQPEVQNLIEFY